MITCKNDGYVGRIQALHEQSIQFIGSSKFFKYKRVPARQSLVIGDIVHLNEIGELNALWHPAQKENTLFMTGCCNQHCLYCPQPREADLPFHKSIIETLITELKRKDINYVTITGGEPTLTGDFLSFTLHSLVTKNPKAIIQVLTNGMIFKNYEYAKKVVEAGKSQTRICVSLHADAASLHDSITGVESSFEQTALGLLNLQRVGADIEIRVVLSKLNAGRLAEMAQFIAMSFPYVSHIAFMGLELHSEAALNAQRVWIDPPEYMNDLSRALFRLKCHNISTSIYNLPYCLVPKDIWGYLRDSISSWKKIFISQCNSCSKKSTCPGLFGTSLFQSPGIVPIIEGN